MEQPAEVVVEMLGDVYPELKTNRETIMTELADEQGRFLKTLQNGEKEFEKLLPNLKKNPKMVIPGRVAFRLYDTYGFPLEIRMSLIIINVAS